MVSFDVGGPPLQTVGAQAKVKNWEPAFTVFQPGFRKIDGNWLIAHDQVSVPADFASGRALLDLEP